MKKIKKLLAMVMAMTMMLGLGLTSFAAENAKSEISVSGLAQTGTNTANAYQVLKPDVTTESGYSFVTGINAIGSFNSADALLDADPDEQIAALKNVNVQELGLTPIPMNIAAGTYTATAQVEAGVYLVVAENEADEGEPAIIYTNPMIVSVTYDTATLQDDGSYAYNVSDTQAHNTVVAKYETIPIEKDKQDEDGSVSLGEVTSYTIETYMPSYTNTFGVIDTLTGAIYNQDSVLVTIGEGEGAVVIDSDSSEYGQVVTFGSEAGTGNPTMTITLDGYIDNHAGQKVVITYDVTVTGEWVNNEIQSTDPDHEYDKDVDGELKTGAVKLRKKGEEEDVNGLNGAVFMLFRTNEDNPEVREYLKITETVNGLKYDWVSKAESNTTFTTKTVGDEKGVIVITGLEKGTYYFEEIQAPNGYSVNTQPVSATVGDNNLTSWDEENDVVIPATPDEATMIDTKLASLPSTGGIGTTIFTIGGCAIMIAAAALYFVNRRKSGEN